MLRHIIQDNENNFGPDGPHGNVAKDLGREHTRKEGFLYVCNVEGK